MSSLRGRAFVALLLVNGCSAPERARSPAPVPEPATLARVDPAEYELRLVPEGCFQYELVRSGAPVWRHPFDAQVVHWSVSPNGSCCVASYTWGQSGCEDVCRGTAPSTILLHVFSLAGVVLSERTFDRSACASVHIAAPESCQQVLFVPAASVWLTRIRDGLNGLERWLWLDDERGAPVAEFELGARLKGRASSAEVMGGSMDVCALYDAPCVLVRWQFRSAKKLRPLLGRTWGERLHWVRHISVLDVDGNLIADLDTSSTALEVAGSVIDRIAVKRIGSRAVELYGHVADSPTHDVVELRLVLRDEGDGRWTCRLQ